MEHIIKNGLEIVVKNSPKTPRTSICCYFAVQKATELSGTHSLIARLLLRGTKKRSAEELTLELQNNGIELTSEAKQDYLKVEILFLNQDFNLAIDILSDILQNSTFEELEKEKFKLRGELTATLDSPVSKVSESFTKTIFEGHWYGSTITKVLKDLDQINMDKIKKEYDAFLNSKKVIVAFGDFENEKEIIQKLDKEYEFLQKYEEKNEIENITILNEDKIVKTTQNSANQANIIQGWIVETIDSKDYPKLIVMNNLLGASGLSSRLFCELRDKQGLAYHVRSSYEAMLHAGVISFYIGTSPKNIKKSLDGFREEITKLQNNLPSDEELQGAKENVLGRLAYFSQTNEQNAGMLARDLILGRSINYRENYVKMINNVTKQDLTDMANKYLSGKSVIAIIAPKKYLDI